ncbi:BCCT family transporter [Aeromicrobium sp. CF3.5]|uniref:BCCT family transporter n=1 Tax=Aeromicrobium sp. CF3.5 TaxID=3373078 RepID=UPI003EE6F0A5
MATTQAPPPSSASAPEPRRRRLAFLDSVHGPVFYPAVAILLTVVLSAVIFPTFTSDVINGAQSSVISGVGWYYTLTVSGFVIFALWMGIGRFGDIKLGKDDDEAEFSLMAWFAMLFAAGMGIGLVFWGAAEPLTFFTSPKPGTTGSDADLANAAMSQVFLHWGFHAWAIYVVVGLAMAYAIHRKGRSVSLRWTLEPIFGDRVKGRLGDVVDVIAVVGTVAGVATSLGLGVQQITAGLASLGIVDEPTNTLRVIVIVVITLAATVSVVSGVGKGIKWLSNANLILAGIFLVAIIALGPTLFLFRDTVQNLGNYLAGIVPMSFDTSALTGDAGIEWQGAWTTFYWGWWMSWAPFVGVFIARISRGRTIREFVAGVMLVPTLVTAIWFTALGGTAIMRQMSEGDLVGPDGVQNSEAVLFNLLDTLPASGLLAGIAIVLVTIFFITSSDSGSLVVDMLASGGEQDPPRWSRIMWTFLEGGVAISLLLAGGLAALQTGAILTAVPFSVVMILMAYATYKALKGEQREITRLARRARVRELEQEMSVHITGNLVENFDEHFAEPVDDRIESAMSRDGNGNGTKGKGPSKT